jgi:hypothetical protein
MTPKLSMETLMGHASRRSSRLGRSAQAIEVTREFEEDMTTPGEKEKKTASLRTPRRVSLGTGPGTGIARRADDSQRVAARSVRSEPEAIDHSRDRSHEESRGDQPTGGLAAVSLESLSPKPLPCGQPQQVTARAEDSMRGLEARE